MTSATDSRADTAALLDINDLHVQFRTGRELVKAVNGVSFRVFAGETMAILGESGSGKSVTMAAVMRLLASPPAYIEATHVQLNGEDVLGLPLADWRARCGRDVGMVFQDALAALNPVFSVGWQLAETFAVHGIAHGRDAQERAVELLSIVGIPDAQQRAGDYPHQFSGGMRQRVMIAMAVALDPMLLIADEPTTALDVTVQAQIMELLDRLQAERNMAIVLITHDLGVVAEAADRVAVMYAGRVVESGTVKDVLTHPRHPYTRALLNSIPDPNESSLSPIIGSPPDMANLPSGCPFRPRCSFATDQCANEEPAIRDAGVNDHHSACHHFEQLIALEVNGNG
jgi:oligopeptide transport system ATP-binding protein